MKLYAWTTESGGVAYGRTIPDVPYIEVESLPDAPQEEWSIVNGKIVVDESKRIPRKLESLEVAVQAHLDYVAGINGYGSIMSACSYAGDANPFQAEAQHFIRWRGAVWAKCYQMVNDWETGLMAEPTEQEVIDSLPLMKDV